MTMTPPADGAAHSATGQAGSSLKPLAGRRAWLITDGKIGMDVQVRGVADALGVDYAFKYVTPEGLYKVLAPWGPVPAREHPGREGSQFAPPWPDIALATGRASIPYVRALKKAAGANIFTVVLQDPKAGIKCADLIWVPEHDRLRGANVITTPTSPHSFTQSRLAELRSTMPPDIAALPSPRFAVVLGGKNAVYKYTDEDDDRLVEAIASLGRLGASFMVTPSRRTHARLLRKVDDATRDFARIFWDGTGPNPYAQFLAHADALVVTADSVNMTGEAAATGRPVFVFTPSRGSAKFDRFHKALQHYGATRPVPPSFTEITNWSYQPLDSAAIIAREIERRYGRRAKMLSDTAPAV